MRTPRSSKTATPIAVAKPAAPAVSDPKARLSTTEARAIVQAIAPELSHYASQYDTTKYWPDVYKRALEQFRCPAAVEPDMLREAILWKYGHLGKLRIPGAQEKLIKQIQRGWPKAVAALPKDPKQAFVVLDRKFGAPTRFITMAFLLHLLYSRQVPIIDQHNFRAVNNLMASVRPIWRSKKKPSQYPDIVIIETFMKTVLTTWGRRAPKSKPNARKLDKFLMMYGKAIKGLE